MAATPSHALEIKDGRSGLPTLELYSGKTLDPMSVGRKGAWAIDAPGMLEEHAFLYFDGASLFLQSVDDESPVLCDGQAIPRAWTRIDPPCTVAMGAAELVFRSLALAFEDDTVANQEPPEHEELEGAPPRHPPEYRAPESSRTRIDRPAFPKVSSRPPPRAPQPTLLGAGPPPRPGSQKPSRPDLPPPVMDAEATRVDRAAGSSSSAPPPGIVRRSPPPAAGRPASPSVRTSGPPPVPSRPPPVPRAPPPPPPAIAIPRATGSAPTLLGDRPVPAPAGVGPAPPPWPPPPSDPSPAWGPPAIPDEPPMGRSQGGIMRSAPAFPPISVPAPPLSQTVVISTPFARRIARLRGRSPALLALVVVVPLSLVALWLILSDDDGAGAARKPGAPAAAPSSSSSSVTPR